MSSEEKVKLELHVSECIDLLFLLENSELNESSFTAQQIDSMTWTQRIIVAFIKEKCYDHLN